MKISLALFVISFMFILSCKKDNLNDDNSSNNNLNNVAATKTLRYEVSCTDCFLTYYGADEQQFSEQHQNSSWYKELQVNKGFVALLVAQNTSGQAAQVTARIKLNGQILKEKTSSCPISGVVLVTDTIQ